MIKQQQMDEQEQNQFPIEELNDKLQLQIPIDNLCRVVAYTSIVSISTMYFGYCLTLISASSYTMLNYYYNIPVSKTIAVSLLNGILPIGAIVGSLLVPYIVPLATKRRIHYYLTIATLIACGITVIPTFYTVLIGRFILGALVAQYLSVSVGYIKETFPSFIRKSLGAIYSTGRVLGILVCYLIAYISNYSQDQSEHIIIFFGPAYLSIIQSLLVRLVLPESIIQMIKKNNYDEANRTLQLIYERRDAERRLKQIQDQLKEVARETIRFQSVQFGNLKNLASLHLAVLRHFCGMSYIVVYAGQVLSRFNISDSKITPVIINSVQLVANLAAIFLIQKRSRTSMLLISCWLMGVINLVIGIADIQSEPILCIVMMAVFMIPCGGGLNAIVYAYPSELVPPSMGKYTSALSWLASAIVSVVPPYVVAAVPGNLAYPMFFFFAFYLGIVSFINIRLLPTIQYENKRKIIALKEMMIK